MFKKFAGKLLLVFSIVLAATVYYLKYPDFRSWVDTHAPAVKQAAAPLTAQWDAHFPQPVAPTPLPMAPEAMATPAPAATAAPEPVSTPAPVVVATPAPQPESDTVDIAQLSQSRTEWPKMVSLKKEVTFPAVLDGKVVGSVKAAAGSEAQLVMIKGEQAGVEFQGGGAMVAIADTDLIDRVKSARRAAGR